MSFDALDDRPPVDPEAALRLIDEQRARTARQISPDPRLYYWPWGVAWLVSFGLFFLRSGPDGRVFVDLPRWLPLVVLFMLLAAARVVSGLAGARAFGQIAGDSARRGAWYGLAWFLGFGGMAATLGQVTDHLPDDLRTLMWSGSAVGLTGALHMAGGAVWLDSNLWRLGAWISVTNVVGAVLGPGWHSLVVCVAGGGGMVVAGFIDHRRWRRP